MAVNIWKKIKCLSSDLQLKATLTGGQSFRCVFCNKKHIHNYKYK